MDSSRFYPNASATVNHVQAKGKKKSGKTSKVVKLSTDPQSVAARERRHRISYRFKVLQSLIPGGTKMDTVTMLEEAINYVKFLKHQIWLHQLMMHAIDDDPSLFASFDPLIPQQASYPLNTTPTDKEPPPPFPVSGFQVREAIMLGHESTKF